MKNEHAQASSKSRGDASAKKKLNGLAQKELSERMRRVRLYNEKRTEIKNLLINDTNKYC